MASDKPGRKLMKTITKKARHLGLAASAGLALSFAAGSAQASDCGEISITEMDWGSAIIVTQVAKFLLEQGYGCTVQIVPSASTPAEALQVSVESI